MKNQSHIYPALDNWFSTPQGLWASKLFTDALHPFKPLLIGRNLLQLGSCGTSIWLNQLQYFKKWIVSPTSTQTPSHIMSDLTHLAFARNTIDCVLAPFTFEAFTNIASLLDEIDRILKPMGFLIVFGINPLSLWGLGTKFDRISGFKPNMLQLHFSFRLNRACYSRGFQQIQLINFGYIPPVQSQTCFNSLFFIDEIGKMIWPFPANFYCYIAQKFEPGYPLQPYFAGAPMESYST